MPLRRSICIQGINFVAAALGDFKEIITRLVAGSSEVAYQTVVAVSQETRRSSTSLSHVFTGLIWRTRRWRYS